MIESVDHTTALSPCSPEIERDTGLHGRRFLAIRNASRTPTLNHSQQAETLQQESDFIGSEVQVRLDELKDSDHPAIHVPVWCGWVTKNSQQAIVLAQLLYWFSQTVSETGMRHGRTRTQIIGEFDGSQDYLCVALSYSDIARQCCMNLKPVRTAVKKLVDLRLVERVRGTTALRRTIAVNEEPVSIPGRNVSCYRLNSEGIYRGLSQYLDQVEWMLSLVRPQHRGTYDGPTWCEIELRLLRNSQRNARSDQQETVLDLLNNPPTDDYAPSLDDEFTGSRVQNVLQATSQWVTVPHWAIRMVSGKTNEALVLARIYGWQEALRMSYGGFNCWETTHKQLAEQVGQLSPGATKKLQCQKVARSLDSLARQGLIQKWAPRSRSRGRFSRIRLLPEGLANELNKIESGDGWVPDVATDGEFE